MSEIDQITEPVAILLQSALREAAPKKSRKFAKSIKVVARPGGIIDIFADEIWKHIEFGTNPHVILPANKKALAFEGKDGQTVIVRNVNHPGTRPTFFIRHTINSKLPKIIKAVLGAR